MSSADAPNSLLSPFTSILAEEELFANDLNSSFLWWQWLERLEGLKLATTPIDLLKIAPQLATQPEVLKLDAKSLDRLQQLLAAYLLLPLKAYLQELPTARSLRLQQALYLYARGQLEGLPSRFPRPQKAPQPLWDQVSQALKQLSFKSAWKNLCLELVESHPTLPWPTVESTSWKRRYLATSKLHQATAFSKKGTVLPITLTCHDQMQLDDPFLASFIEQFSNLKNLTLHQCKSAGTLTAQVLMQQLPNYEHLGLDYCPKLPLEEIDLSQAKNLKSLSLKKAKINQALEQLSKLPLLHTLDLNESDLLSDHVVKMPPCHSLRRLSLHSCRDLAGLGFEMLAMAMPKLSHLNASGCAGFHSGVLSELPPLQKLVGSWCDGLDDTLIDHLLDKHANLHTLTLDHCRYLSDLGAEAIGELERLSHLNLSYCPSITPDGLTACLKKQASLRSLHLAGQTLYDQAYWFETLEHLQALSLPQNSTLESTLRLPSEQLTYLHMKAGSHWSCDQLTTLLSSSICSRLETLIIEQASGVKDRTLEALTRLSSLKHLSLAASPEHPQIFDHQFAKLSQLPSLERLELSYGGRCDFVTMKQILLQAPHLKELEIGPMYRLSSSDIQALRSELPWLRITCFGYEGLSAF